jgi:hypothetical protein
MEMKFEETGLARCLLEQNTRLIFGGEKVGCAAEPTEGIVMEQLRHDEMRLPTGQSFHARAARNQRERAGNKSQAPEAHCTRKSPLPLLPSGPGGVGGNASRGTDA